MAQMSNLCAVCNKPTNHTCAGCQLMYYCGESCQGADWRTKHFYDCALLGNKAKVRKVMREFYAGKLHSSSGQLVTDRRQALAIALNE